jgi:gas vesicle protein
MADNLGGKVSYFMVGLGVGALLGILFAPKSGEETREYLVGKAEEGKEYAQRKARELRERAEDLLERSKEVAKNQKDSISAAVDAGREAYQREKAKA